MVEGVGCGLRPRRWLAQVIQNVQSVIGVNASQFQSAVYQPRSGLVNPYMSNMIYVVTPPNPSGYIDAYGKFINDLDGIDFGRLQYKTQFESSATEVAGRQISQYTIAVQMDDSIRQQLGPNAEMMQDQRGLLLQTDDAVVAAINADDAALNQAIDAVAGEGDFDEEGEIVALRRHLPKRRIAEMCFNVSPIIEMAGQIRPIRSVARKILDNAPPRCDGRDRKRGEHRHAELHPHAGHYHDQARSQIQSWLGSQTSRPKW